MRPDNLLLLSIGSLLLLHPAAALCVPRNATYSLIDHDSNTNTVTEHQLPVMLPSVDSLTDPDNIPVKVSPSTSAVSADTLPKPHIPDKLPSADSILDAPIKAMCARTSYTDLCESTVQSVVKATGSIDAKAILFASINAATGKTKTAKDLAIKFSTDPNLSTMVQNFVAGCPSHYDDALDCLSTALSAIAEHDRPTAETNLNAYVTNVNTCEDDFEEMAAASPMLPYDNELSKLGSNILDFFKMFK